MILSSLILLEARSPARDLRDIVDLIITPIGPFLIFGLIFWILRRVLRKVNKSPRSIIINHFADQPPSIKQHDFTLLSSINNIDYSITPSDPRFHTLPWEYKEALYVKRIKQLSDRCKKLQEKLDAAGIK